MPDLTPKQEAFARSYVETGNASEAYRRSYDVGADTKPETVWNEGYKLTSNPDVGARIAELLAEARAMSLVTVGSLTTELEAARNKAMSEGKGASAAVSAIMGKAKLHKLLDDDKAGTGVTVQVVITGKDASIL